MHLEAEEEGRTYLASLRIFCFDVVRSCIMLALYGGVGRS